MKKAIALFLTAAVLAPAQHKHHASDAKKPAELLEGLGSHTHPIATRSELTQKFFDQGLALIFGFNHDEAARLFARAAELDPQSPMPHWGIALSLGPNYNMPPLPEREEKAWRAIEKAIELSSMAITSALMWKRSSSGIPRILTKTVRSSERLTRMP
ncbi:MAG TPA: hypothetical protein VM120_05795 [Bryobacteraceae bacterium]|nr:hypothetical protein [Bryobacteraceae bacterium]